MKNTKQYNQQYRRKLWADVYAGELFSSGNVQVAELAAADAVSSFNKFFSTKNEETNDDNKPPSESAKA